MPLTKHALIRRNTCACPRPPRASRISRKRPVLAGQSLLGATALAGLLCATAMPAHANEPWVLVDKTTFDYATAINRAQGLTTDGVNWIFSGENMLEITDADFNTILLDSSAIVDELATPSDIAVVGLNHIGDIYYDKGLLYLPLDSSKDEPVSGENYQTPVIAIYNASDLTYTGKSYAITTPDGTDDIASWVAVDSDAGVGYTMAYNNSTKIAVYDLNDWSFVRYIPLESVIDNAQGGKIKDGWMYFSTDGDSKSVYRANLSTGAVEELFNLKIEGGQEVEGLSFKMTKDGQALFVQNLEFDILSEVLYEYLLPYGNALSGEVHASLKTVLLEDSGLLRSAVSDRLQAILGGQGGVVATNGIIPSRQNPMQGVNMWAKVLGATGKIDGSGDAASITHDTNGLLLGADTMLGDWRIGALAGFGNTTFDVGDRSSDGSSRNLHFGAYAGTQFGNLNVKTGAFYTRHDIETTRDVCFPLVNETLEADYESTTLQAFGELGYEITTAKGAFEPFANLALIHQHSESFQETGGSTAGLSTGSRDFETRLATLGLRASRDLSLGRSAAKLRGMLGWQHAWGDITPGLDMAFANGTSFSSTGVSMAKDALSLEIGLDMTLSETTSLGASYSGRRAEGSQYNALNVSVTMAF
ncbi:hypothetical protein P775_07665 [Puniceibacterium antarcticum]|uniref:Autotransporter domain-containing protein n=1 Tax=Puniceibacterium antarcticum TaxID=1206336 RepID=A0A2G8RGS5_9RHOB|nr:autotransporter domain-containing protein [Puniceibacterium antarcticum]PIL20777.1 hypothetical protein P775_07665 [Puniceibacterium antarcticum]